ncbi:MAG: rod shape-determining protein MreD, partial [Planctomycetaceae bacterium]
MKHLLVAAMTYFMLVLQIAVPGHIAILGYAPVFPLLALIAAFGLFEGTALLFWSGMVGLSCDLLGTGPLGREMFAYTLVAVFAGQMFGRNETRSIVWALFASFSLAATALIFSSAVDVLISGRQVSRIELLEQIGATSLYT